MLKSAFKSFEQLFSKPFRAVLWKSLGLTLVLFIAAWFGLQALLSGFAIETYPWINTIIAILTGIGLIIGFVFIIGPITALFAGLFLDEISQLVEKAHYPTDPPGKEQASLSSFLMAVKFTIIIILVNIIVLLLMILPGVNIMAYLIGNGYLLGREYFEMIAMRHMTSVDARALRRKNRASVWFAGMLIAFMAAIPFVNLLTPLFATAFMVHLFKSLAPKPTLVI